MGKRSVISFIGLNVQEEFLEMLRCTETSLSDYPVTKIYILEERYHQETVPGDVQH